MRVLPAPLPADTLETCCLSFSSRANISTMFSARRWLSCDSSPASRIWTVPSFPEM